MNDQEMIDRFEELEAGRALGDLDAQEVEEWKELCRSLDAQPDWSLELTAGAVEAEFAMAREEDLPSELAETLFRDIPRVAAPAPEAGLEGESNIIRPGIWKRITSSTQVAWSVAAVLTALLVASVLSKGSKDDRPDIVVTTPSKISPDYAKSEFLKRAKDVLTVDFAGLPGYEGITGDLVWSDTLQEGYMTFTDLPANDPAKKQYQLWIVDPSRDDEPVDGGVFNIPFGQKTAVVPIKNPLAVSKPAAFLVTLEKPGGVVVSTQDVKVALAKPS